ncbi:hypothetical protein DPMN_060591 [Dreissena polymorpha]|uniref:TatD related DNase n=1 Tax=Dreissena polymorpha TaxID=45954 RepID=A0A9D4C669_DREPO|nr:hypothetical protein DPMN_060591 [Dreissena polymorpha]
MTKSDSCPIRGCRGDFSLRHTLRSHLPEVMDLRVPVHDNLTRRRLGFFLAMGARVIREGTTLVDLMRFCSTMGYTLHGASGNPSQIEAAGALARASGEEAVAFLDLLHWSILTKLWALLPVNEQEFFRSTYALSLEERESTSRWPEAVDSHCHLDRWSRKVNVNLDINIWKSMACMSPLVEVEINLRAVVTNFCDPSTYPNISLLETLYGVRCFSTIGLHPKGATKYTDADIQKFCMLLERPEVVGFGEVGLDHSVPYAEWLGQAILLKRVFSFLKERHVLVLHCRGADGDIHGKEVHMCLLSIMLGVVSPEQRIHLHCFQ